jgi:hypothetical protein
MQQNDYAFHRTIDADDLNADDYDEDMADASNCRHPTIPYHGQHPDPLLDIDQKLVNGFEGIKNDMNGIADRLDKIQAELLSARNCQAQQGSVS